MPKPKLKNADLQKVKTQSNLLALLRGPLGWPLIEDDESLFYTVAEVGKVNVQQLLRFADDDPWLILLVEFDGPFKRDDIRKALREIRKQQKQQGKYEGKRVSDILFICAAQDYREIQFVRFVERGSRQPKLKVFGWNPGTQNQNKTACQVCLPALALETTEEGYPDWSKAHWNQAWDVEKVTTEFFKGFDDLRCKTFKILRPEFGEPTPPNVKDDPRDAAANWATSVQLNRLLFVYFLADQGFLPGGTERLHAALAKGNFHSWFQTLALNALGASGKRPEGFEDIPYLNGGLFVLHGTEQGRQLTLPDSHYKEWLAFLGSFRWTLSENEGVNTISPHILGYLFERYINQKQMGAYYTKEDVTGYICRSTVIPRLFDKIAETRGKPVHLDIGALSDDGNRRYIFPSVKQRAYLPIETPYEYKQRQERLQRLDKTDLNTVDDFVTNNLNLELLAEDWLATRKDPAELLAAYDALQSITILDPTVGSGAFLLAALEILAPLYDFVLRRMDAMVKESGTPPPQVNWAGELNLEEAFDQKVLADPAESETISAMRSCLAEVAKHENSGYFIRKRILLNNLYGVDIMPEAVEICKLRLYLALVSAASPDSKLEPLPDVDLNYRAGNALVGFATLHEIQEYFNPKGTLGLEFGEERLIRASVKKVQEINWRQEAGEVPHELIEEVEEERRAAVLGLDRHQAEMRGLVFDEEFRRSHRPFHWLAEYPTVVLERSGFDVIIGNPPFVEWAKVQGYDVHGFKTRVCGNTSATVVERSLSLLVNKGRFGLVLPISTVATERMQSLRDLLLAKLPLQWRSLFSIRPSKLFVGAEQRLCLTVGSSKPGAVYSTKYHRWREEERPHLLEWMSFGEVPEGIEHAGVGDSIAGKLMRNLPKNTLSAHWNAGGDSVVYWHRIPQYFVKATDFVPYFWSDRDGVKKSEDYKPFPVRAKDSPFIIASLMSSLFYWYWFNTSEGYHVGKHEVLAFPSCHISDALRVELEPITHELMKDIQRHSNRRQRTQATTNVEYDEFYVKHSKHLLDQIDCILARHYGLTDEELEFIINYDIKYRMGRDGAEDVE